MNEKLNAVLSEYAREKVEEKGNRQFLDAAALIATDGGIKETKKDINAELQKANFEDEATISDIIAEEDSALKGALEAAKLRRDARKTAMLARAPEPVARIKARAEFASVAKLNAIYEALGLPIKEMTVRVAMPVKSMAQAVQIRA